MTEYKNSVDPQMIEFIKKARTVKNNDYRNIMKYEISDVSDRAAADIYKETGVDVTGYKHAIKGNRVSHTDARHGEQGEANRSMKDDNDVARVGYILNNYDNVSLSKVKDEKLREYTDKNGKPAPRVVFTKKIDGTYYVVEAVPDAKAKTLFVVTMYYTKDSKASSNVLNMETTPQHTSETLRRTYSPAVSDTVPQAAPTVKGQTGKNYGAAGAVMGLVEGDVEERQEASREVKRMSQEEAEQAIRDMRDAGVESNAERLVFGWLINSSAADVVYDEGLKSKSLDGKGAFILSDYRAMLDKAGENLDALYTDTSVGAAQPMRGEQVKTQNVASRLRGGTTPSVSGDWPLTAPLEGEPRRRNEI